MDRNVSRSGLARRHRHQRYAIKTWVDRLPDTPAFIIGNGPSINDINISLVEEYFSIGINRAFYVLDPTILLWQDVSLWNSEYHKVHNLQALKVCRDVADPRRVYYNFHLRGGGYKFDTTKTHILHGRGSSGPLAIQLAVSMGCRPLILLGMDCKRGDDGRSDFYGENKYWREHTLSNCESGLKYVKDHCPVEIRNCSSNTFWPNEQLEDVIKDIDPIHKRGRASLVKQIKRIN